VEDPLAKEEGFYSASSFDVVTQRAPKYNLKRQNYNHSKKKRTEFAIQINQPTRCNNFSSLLLDVYLQLNMFRASSRPSSGAQ
jgi:hypothetical protein